MAIGCLEVVADVIAKYVADEKIDELKLKKVEKFLLPLRQASKNADYAFFGSICLFMIIFNGLGEQGKEAFDFLVDSVILDVENPTYQTSIFASM